MLISLLSPFIMTDDFLQWLFPVCALVCGRRKAPPSLPPNDNESWARVTHESRSHNISARIITAARIVCRSANHTRTTAMRVRVFHWFRNCPVYLNLGPEKKLKSPRARTALSSIRNAGVNWLAPGYDKSSVCNWYKCEHVSSSVLSLNALAINHFVCFCSRCDTEWAHFGVFIPGFIQPLHTRAHTRPAAGWTGPIRMCAP